MDLGEVLSYTARMTSEQLAELSKEQLIVIILQLQERIAKLEAAGGNQGPPAGPTSAKESSPPWVKRNRPKREGPKKPRRKRDSKHNHARRLETPTRTVDHRLDRCPKCDGSFQQETLAYARQVIELPPPQAVEVIEHRVISSFCPQCLRWHTAELDLTGQVFGQGRMGVGITALVAYLRNSLRLPYRRIQDYLLTIHQLVISVGELVELLHEMRRVTHKEVEGLKKQAQASAILHADETGWRENGQNGYIWGFFTPGEEPVRYYEYDASRGQAVVARILGGKFHGHLATDFYAGYNDYEGPHQRCWTHLLRDLHELKEDHSQDAEVLQWAGSVRKVYDDAKQWLETARAPDQEARAKKYVELTGRTHELGLQFAKNKDSPCCALAKRLMRHEDELFQFVLVAGLSADNNLAERSLRPLVVIRKISGGSRSTDGTQTRMALASLFETWRARGLNAYAEGLKLLSCPKAIKAQAPA